MRASSVAGLAAIAVTMMACATGPSLDPERVDAVVTATVETARVAGRGDAADDPALWVGAGAAPLILGTDKTAGLYSYTLDGAVAQYEAWGRLNNVDVRPRFPATGGVITLAAATDRTNLALRLFAIEDDGTFRALDGGSVALDVDDPYGLCLGRDASGAFHAVATGKDGGVRQFTIAPAPDGGVTASEVRRFALSSIAEGCVIDDRTGQLYIGEENVGVWMFDLDPATGEDGTMIAPIDDERLVADVEGLAIYAAGTDGGYLIASSQGDSAYAVFALPDHAYVGRFAIVDGVVDGVTETDGIEATSTALPGFPAGVFLAQDDADDTGGQNFKLVDWTDIAAALSLD